MFRFLNAFLSLIVGLTEGLYGMFFIAYHYFLISWKYDEMIDDIDPVIVDSEIGERLDA